MPRIKSLKIVLMILGILCLISAVFAILPWGLIECMARPFGIAEFLGGPVVPYLVRSYCMLVGIVGIFFLILAKDPSRYKPMLILAIWGLFLVGLTCLVTGYLVGMSPASYLGDGLFCLVFGALLFLLAR